MSVELHYFDDAPLSRQDWQNYRYIIRKLETTFILYTQEDIKFLYFMCNHFRNRKAIIRRLIKFWVLGNTKIYYRSKTNCVSISLSVLTRAFDQVLNIYTSSSVRIFEITLDDKVTNWLLSTGWVIPWNMTLNEMFYQQALGTVPDIVHMLVTEKCPDYNYIAPYEMR